MNVTRILIVGGVAGGASCAVRCRRLSESAHITILERGPYISFANCGLPYHVGGVIADRAALLLQSPEALKSRFNIDVRVNTEVVRIDRAAKEVEVRDTRTGATARHPYDALVLSPGAAPIRPPLPGIDSAGIFTVRSVPDVDAINEWIDTRRAARAVVVGGGFIGLEMAENLIRRGLAVALVEKLNQVMPPLDPEMAEPVHDELAKHGIELVLGDGVAGFDAGDGQAAGHGLIVRTERGRAIPADLVILAIGVKPETALAREAGLEIGPRGGIRVDDRQQTSDPAIWAVGDAVEVRDFITGEPALIPLAGPANRQGRIAADNLFGRDSRFRGSQGTAVVGVFDLTVASTGASEKALRRAGIAYHKACVHPGHHVGYYPGAEPMMLKVLYAPETGRVLGAQAVGGAGVDKRIDVLALAIQAGVSVFDLEEAELCYAPQYGSAKDPVNMAGFVASNELRGDAPLAHWEDVFEAGDGDSAPVILDVRNPPERESGSVPGSVNIPLDDLRDRLNELPRDREIWAHCGVGQRSYYATRILRQHGFRARNLTGGLKTWAVVRQCRTPRQ